MAVTAKFAADFSDFQSAVTKAEVSLKSFESGAGKVQTSLTKMANSLSGTKLIQDATLMAEAVERVGGVSKLTEQELQRVSTQAKEAAAKLIAMGQDVPPGIQKIADATKNVGSGLTSMKGMITSAAGAFGLAFSVGSVVAFGKSVLDAAGQINDMASQMGISTDAVQGFKQAAEDSGSSLDAVGAAITKMNDKLGEGGKGTVSALKEAGLSFQQIRSLKPEDGFLAIADALEKIPDKAKQTQIAVELFGRSGAELLPAIQEGFRETAAAADKMSAETIKALDDAGDAWGRLGTKVTIVTGEMIAATEKGFSGMVSGIKNLTTSLGHFQVFASNVVTMGVGPALALADAWEQASKGGQKAKDTNLSLPGPIKQTKEAMDAAAAAAKKYGDAFNAMFDKFSGKAATAEMNMLDAVFRKLADSGKITKDQVEAFAKEAVKLQGEGAKLTERLYEIAKATDVLNPHLKVTELNLGSIGTKVDVVIPKLNSYAEALKTLDGLSKTMTIGNITLGGAKGIDIGKPIITDLMKATTDWAKSLRDVTQAFDLLASASTGSLSRVLASVGDVTNALAYAATITKKDGSQGKLGILTAMFDADAKGAEKWAAAIQAAVTVAAGAMAVWNDTASAGSKSAGALTGALSGAKAGAAFGPYGAAIGAVAGAVTGMIHAMSAGRREVEAFAKSFDTQAVGSGFDELQKKMLTLGDDYERLWKKLTQQTGKGDKKGAQAVIAEIEAALANTPMALAAAAGFQTTAELQAVADKAKSVYDYMVKSGKYSASEIARAFAASTEAQKALFGDAAKAQQDALDATSKKYDDIIGKLKGELGSFSSELQAEQDAPEFDELGNRIYGVVELQQMKRKEQLDQDIKNAEQLRDAEIAAQEDTFAAMYEAGKTVDDALRELFGKPYQMGDPVWKMPGGDWGNSGPGVTPPGTSPESSALYRGSPGRVGGEGAVHVYIGNQAVDNHVLRVVRTRTPGDLMVRGR